MRMTVLLYQTDSYLRRFDATVTAAGGDEGEERAVILDRTAFYPGGGGQPHDLGTLEVGGQIWPVVSVARRGGDVVHLLGGDDSLPATGATVRGALDWERRYRLMRTHTALHVLCGTIWRAFGAQVTGGQMYLDRARMDFELEDLSPERVRSIEGRANAAIAAGAPVTVRLLPRAAAFAIPDLIRTKINLLPPGIQEVRVVSVGDLDTQADGGTHVADAREIGGIRIAGTRSKGRINKRLEVALVDRE
jgi:misacylated tRNA(Ala) deacylase